MNYPVRVTYATNADTEVLALRVAWEDLPGDIELRVVGLGELGGLEDARAGDIVVVRALGGDRSGARRRRPCGPRARSRRPPPGPARGGGL